MNEPDDIKNSSDPNPSDSLFSSTKIGDVWIKVTGELTETTTVIGKNAAFVTISTAVIRKDALGMKRTPVNRANQAIVKTVDISRSDFIKMVHDMNQSRYPNIRLVPAKQAAANGVACGNYQLSSIRHFKHVERAVEMAVSKLEAPSPMHCIIQDAIGAGSLESVALARNLGFEPFQIYRPKDTKTAHDRDREQDLECES